MEGTGGTGKLTWSGIDYRIWPRSLEMRNLDEIVKILREKKDYLETVLGVKKLKVFGSFAEGTQDSESDLDLIAEFKTTPTLFEVVKIENEISEMVSVEVDLLTEEAISPYILAQIKPVEIL
jgi:uncharacterized protein